MYIASGIRPSPKHTEAVRDYPPPRSKEDISKFLGLLNFFRSFLPEAAGILQPLTNLMKKSAVFTWGKEQQEAFQRAKQSLLNAVTLQHPSPTAQVQLNTDASATHVRAALLQGRRAAAVGAGGFLLQVTERGPAKVFNFRQGAAWRFPGGEEIQTYAGW